MGQSEYISWVKCTSWLSNFVNLRGLRQPDGRPLYEYHATNAEYNQLTQLLCAVGQSQSNICNRDFAACFVLFCSEWYRRDYERQCGWTWDPIYKKIGISFTATELGTIVPKGMEDYWLRPIRFYESERRNFLGTLFSEGGLPFRLLKESDSRFLAVFSRILGQYEQAKQSGFSALSLARAVIEKSALPTVFSEDTSVELISHMADNLNSLVLTHNLTNHKEPVQQLDKVHPTWRSEFPIPLDDETGTHFLNGLLCAASVEVKPRLQKNKSTRCQFYWSEKHPDELRVIVSLPDEVSFPVTSEPSTTRFELAIYEDGEEVSGLGPAYASLENRQATVRLRKSEVRFVRQNPSAGLSLVARAGGMIVGSIKLDDSEIAIGEVPLTFIVDADQWLLTNNIETMKFVPVVPAWVFVKAEPVPLPNPLMGYMASGADGHVFQQSLGEGGHGYALCLSCGRAESMLNENDAPKSMEAHYPPRPGKADRDSQNHRLICPGSTALMKNVTLGALARTDVFEMVLRKPQNGEYLPDNTEEGRIVAMTLAVALRQALAGVLGISAAELGYSVRPVRLEDGQSVLAVQLYDVISGGAGFASSAPVHIEAILQGMVKQLGCRHCDTACSECLLDSQTRHDHDLLDRKVALAWLGDDFTYYIGLPDEETFSLPDARYCPGAIGDTIRRAINEGAEKLTLWMTGAPNEWDLYARQFRAAIQSYRLKDNVEVDLVIPAGVDDPDLLHELSQFTALGVRLCHVEQELQLPIVAQVTFADRVMTLASRSQQATIPGPEWHLNDELVVRSLGYQTVELNEFILPAKAANAVERVKDIQIHKQLNGPLSQFGQRFWDVLFNDHEEAQSLMKNTRITGVHYTDRYLQNPVALALLGSILKPLKTKLTDGAEVALDTLFKDKDRPGNRPFHDWMSIADFQDFADQWFAAALGRPIELTVFDSPRDIPHHRKLTVTFEDGQVLKIRFDQGMGYWRINFASQWHYFDFRDDVSFQLVKMAQACKEGNVANSEESWATDVLVEVIAS